MAKDKGMFLPGFEPGTFRVLGERDDHYTTETAQGRQFQHASTDLQELLLLF